MKLSLHPDGYCAMGFTREQWESMEPSSFRDQNIRRTISWVREPASSSTVVTVAILQFPTVLLNGAKPTKTAKRGQFRFFFPPAALGQCVEVGIFSATESTAEHHENIAGWSPSICSTKTSKGEFFIIAARVSNFDEKSVSHFSDKPATPTWSSSELENFQRGAAMRNLGLIAYSRPEDHQTLGIIEMTGIAIRTSSA